MSDAYAALMLEDDYGHFTEQEWNETPAQMRARLKDEARAKAKPAAKGHCRHCGKHIGKGVAFHEKACSK